MVSGSPMTLCRSAVRAVVVPLRHPIIAAIGRFDHWPLVLVDVEMTDGVVGSSYIAPYRAKSLRVVVAELRDLLEGLQGRDIAPGDAFAEALKSLNVVGVAGISTIAVSAIDMALWDALAKTAGLPLAQLLGGSVGPLRAYNSNGLWRHEISTLGSEAKALVGEGRFTALKMRLGNTHLRDDLAAIDAVRQGIGDDIDLMVDFNQALGLGDAIRRCHELDEQNLYWFEEPIAYDNVRGYAQLARHVRTPLQAGENYYGARDLLNVLDSGGVHYAMGDLMRIGGVTGWLQTAGVAAASGIQFSNHLYPEFAAHLLRVTPTAHWLEWVDWACPILATPLQPEAGMLSASDQPGAGLVWDDRAVKKYAVQL
ncbi:enolase C-terminal domain-like protein [Mycobacterium sp. NPDC048908]|uniref:enolase C-terminal domain-like protein n=1 Tax=Mycobacterium sp. NPDC048908 TaxID=3364292 RepID=UPI00371436CE